MEFSCTGKTIPGLFMLVFGALTFLLDSVFGVFLIILVPVLAVDFLVFFGTGFGRLGHLYPLVSLFLSSDPA